MAPSLFARLLGQGYFPKELPPPFATASLSKAVGGQRAKLDQVLPLPGWGAAHLGIHNLARAGTLRRRLGIPNPVFHARVASVIAANWSFLRTKLKEPPYSVSVPLARASEKRALVPNLTFAELPSVRANRRCGARFVLRADIARFYPSIYTHAVPWALHSKRKAKKTLGKKKGGKRSVGDQLDIALRNAQDRQTLGIPIGPDTSLLVGEMILGAVDKKLQRRIQATNGYRHYDDYELYFATRSDAEAAASLLQETLAEYELDLGPEKTDIVALPLEHELAWAADLRATSKSFVRKLGETDLIRYFDYSFSLSRAHPNSHVLSYAVSHLQRRTTEDNWPLLQSLLLQVVLAEPGTFRHVVQQFIDAEEEGWKIDLDQLAKIMNMQISDHARLAHGSEVAWALWTMLRFKLPLQNSAAADLARVADDSVVALLALDARSRKLAGRSLSLAAWKARMTTPELYGPAWLLCYEASVKGWLPSKGADHIGQDVAFSFLRSSGVSFYDPSLTLQPTAREAVLAGDDTDADEEFEYLAGMATDTDTTSP